MSLIDKLQPLRAHRGAVRTRGLDDAMVERLGARFPELDTAIDAALAQYAQIRGEFADLLDLDETAQVRLAQEGFVNFYPDDSVNPYVALAAHGPWLVTLKGAVIYDCGGYGMLGGGHTPARVLEVLRRPQAMANIMTPSLSHLRFAHALKREISQGRGGCPYTKFLCLSSGSEVVSLAGRIIDVNAKLQTEVGARHADKKIKRVAVKGAFHGRTELPAIYSDSTRKTYLQHLASFRDEKSLLTVEPYNAEQLRNVFAEAEQCGWFIEAIFLEPVMGEGDPGRALPTEFYAVARELTQAHGSLLLVDSIQAGLRAHGVLSVVDYPNFGQLPPPDMETFSKALNAGQYPLSVLAVGEQAAELYRKGLYGSTMTSNPRALDVACAVLDSLTPNLRANIVARGREFIDKLDKLKNELDGLITRVQGTGLLCSCELSDAFKCYGTDSIEEYLRERGLGVIHGGANSLRFTPHFAVSSEEIDLVIANVRQAMLQGPRKAQAQAA